MKWGGGGELLVGWEVGTGSQKSAEDKQCLYVDEIFKLLSLGTELSSRIFFVGEWIWELMRNGGGELSF